VLKGGSIVALLGKRRTTTKSLLRLLLLVSLFIWSNLDAYAAEAPARFSLVYGAMSDLSFPGHCKGSHESRVYTAARSGEGKCSVSIVGIGYVA
jgi:hypothetical protein